MDGITFAFVLICCVIVVTPGADMALVARNVASGGARALLGTVTGIHLAVLLHMSLAIAGISHVLTSVPMILPAIQYCGALYLMYLGVQSLRSVFAESADLPDSTVGAARPFWSGFVTNLLNPKIVVFYVTLIPQFITSERSTPVDVFLLGLTHFLLSLIWLSFFGWMSHRVTSAADANRRLVPAVSGCCLIFFGVVLAFWREAL